MGMLATSATADQSYSGSERPVGGKLLVVDDEPSIRWALRKTLQGLAFEIVEAESGEQAIALVRTVRLDVVLLDIGMPGMDGVETCRRIRKLAPLLGIVMLTVRDTEEDKIDALDAGADDYITKPFKVRELAARLRATVRRSVAARVDTAAPIRVGEIELDPVRRYVRKSGVDIHMTPKEFDMLHLLMANAGLPLTHVRILTSVWGPQYGGELEYLRTMMRQLRKKLGDDAAAPRYLVTEAQVGYRFKADAMAAGRTV